LVEANQLVYITRGKENTHEKIVGKERKDGKLKQIKKKEIKISGT
jgi:hypothetical protein